jgi:hypothetical protein
MAPHREGLLNIQWRPRPLLAGELTMPGSGSQRNIERAGFRLAYTRALLGLPQ